MAWARRHWDHFLAIRHSPDRDRFMAYLKENQPGFFEAVLADTRMTAAHRGERFEHRSRLDGVLQAVRLCVVSDAFLGQVCYRAKTATWRMGIPFVPKVFHRLAIMTGQVCIGEPVILAPGVYLPHGQVVIDGIVHISERVLIAPFVSIGLIAGEFAGPTIGPGAKIGTGSRLLGPITIGAEAQIGANAVVVKDVPAGRVAVGIPAKVVGDG
ncbi:MAG: hypothetical protein R2695_13745 [Acidimicrobiales bacterium]